MPYRTAHTCARPAPEPALELRLALFAWVVRAFAALLLFAGGGIMAAWAMGDGAFGWGLSLLSMPAAACALAFVTFKKSRFVITTHPDGISIADRVCTRHVPFSKLAPNTSELSGEFTLDCDRQIKLPLSELRIEDILALGELLRELARRQYDDWVMVNGELVRTPDALGH